MDHHEETITTIEDLAAMIQNTMASKEDVQALRAEMATKAELQLLRQEIKEGFEGVYAELNGLKDAIKQYRQAGRIEYAALLERIEQLKEWKKSVESKM